MTVLDHLREKGIGISAPCGGKGVCGKCLVDIDGLGTVCACKTEYEPGMRIRVVQNPGHMSALGIEDTDPEFPGVGDSGRYGIAIDLGTTTIAGALCDTGSGRVIAQRSQLNPDTAYGADVISRIRSGSEGHGRKMREALCKGLREIVSGLVGDLSDREIGKDGLGKDGLGMDRPGMDGIGMDRTGKGGIGMLTIAGNTTMIHTLMGYDLSVLGHYPYKPVNTALIEKTAADILEIETFDIFGKKEVPCVIFPGISAFVGGDIVSGLYYLNSLEENRNSDGVYALMDLGTNGEMAIVTDDIIHVASSAAGPVFEGGGISCGTGSVRGAIDHIRIDGDRDDGYEVKYSTIGEETDIKGICGSGVTDCVAEIFKAGLCDSSGFILDGEPFLVARYPDRSPLAFTQDDMRQFQLAKAAISAGFEVLCRRAGISPEEIDRLYLAGGMGVAIDTRAASAVGLLPEMPENSIIPTGNTSLKGAIRLLTDVSSSGRKYEELLRIVERSRVTDLAEDPEFTDIYMEHIDLG
ncbi:MAG: ASKHA domain-containing protein [Lachnospiraceae bacterium]|nr:ASKHA domain-containing protein [Lachnospiraceae bacterium]